MKYFKVMTFILMVLLLYLSSEKVSIIMFLFTNLQRLGIKFLVTHVPEFNLIYIRLAFTISSFIQLLHGKNILRNNMLIANALKRTLKALHYKYNQNED